MDSSISISVLSEGNGEENVVVNAYGPFVGDHEATNNSTMEDRTFCDCKSQCARKKGRGACKCREGNLRCHDLCACDKGKCKYKANDDEAAEVGRQPQSANVNNGELRFEEEIQHAETEIKEILATLDPVVKDRTLVKLLRMGRGSIDFAKKLASEHPEDPEPPLEDTPEWCKCRVCRPMPDEQENVCCKRVTCITSYTSFSNMCLDRDILEVCIKARCDIRVDDFNFGKLRKAGYRQFALWRYGKLGRGNRRVIPACAVRRIRAQYPAPDGRYMRFRANWVSEFTLVILRTRPICFLHQIF